MQRNGGDRRGSAQDRRRRKHWMLAWYGDGTSVHCVHCGKLLSFATMEQDRIVPGGPYNRRNIQPSCEPCNKRRGDCPITPFPPGVKCSTI